MIPVLKEYKLKAQSEFVIEIEDSDRKWGNRAKVTKDFCAEIGNKEIIPYQLSNTFITLSLADDVGIVYVNESVGHTKFGTAVKHHTWSAPKGKNG